MRWTEAEQREIQVICARIPDVDPIVLQIVEGTLNSIEAEIEFAVERTARSPMIREAHDFRVGLFDRFQRKLTGRSYSAMPDAVTRDYAPETMQPGDAYFMNDTYDTEGAIGHLPDMCSTIPAFFDDDLVAYIQVFGHHDDIGGKVPGSMPGTALSVFEEGLMIPPIKLYDRGLRNEEAFKIIRRNSRVPEMLEADVDSEVQAVIMGAVRMSELFARFGKDVVETCFAAIFERTRQIFLNELFPKIADGTYYAEDYVEHDAFTDPLLHKIAVTMTKRADKITLDFNGTDAQAVGPINWAADYAEGRFLIKWIAPIMRNLADTPERAAEIPCNEGVVDLFEVVFPEKGTLITPIRPAPTNARAFVLLRMLSLFAGVLAQAVDGKMPADQETIRYTGFYGYDQAGDYFLSREVLGGGGGGRYYADGSDAIHVVPDSRNQPAEFTETRYPLRVEKLALAPDSGGAGEFRGGLGYEKEYRSLTGCFTLVSADRVRLGCYGVNGGHAGAPFGVFVDAEGAARKLGGLEDEIPITGGELMRVITTGGGGWGNPLDRDPGAVRMDVWQGKVSAERALEDYGVVIAAFDDDEPIIDASATETRRAEMRKQQPLERAIIDRGPGIDAVTPANPSAGKPKRYG
jgi:N-methylhydantoinase B